MDTMNYATMNQQNNVYPMWGGVNPYPGAPVTYNPAVPQPTNISSLSEEEIKLISQKKPSKIDINISQEDHLRSMCNHNHNGHSVVQPLNDGSGKVYCPSCGAVWNSDIADKEQVQGAVDLIYDQMQNAKWAGDYNVELVRDYFPIIELLKKFPDLHEYAMQTHTKYVNAGQYQNANEAAVFSQFNNLMYGTPTPMMGYGQYFGQPQQPVYGQQAPMGQQPVYNPAQGYQQGVPASPMTNPMQAPMGQIPVNPQFTNQADMMMQGGYYAQPQQPAYGQQAPYAPQYAPVGQAPMAQPQQQSAPVATTQPATTNEQGEAQTSSTVTLN